MPRETVEPTPREPGMHTDTSHEHPSWALMGASRVSSSPPGAVLFDSDLRHQHYVVVTLRQAVRDRSLNRDHVHTAGRAPIVQAAMSEAQWASFVSSMNTGDGVPVTLQYREGHGEVPSEPYAPRLKESMADVAKAADKSLEAIREAFAAVEAKPTKANVRHLGFVIGNAPSNMTFAAKSLSEHTENVVTKARADLEAMVVSKANQLGIDPSELGGFHELTAGEPVEADVVADETEGEVQ